MEKILINDSPYSNHTPKDWVMEFIERYGQIDGAHHKQWLIDQITRIVLGAPIELFKQGSQYMFRTGTSKEYLDWVIKMREYDEEYDEYTFEYDYGTPP